MNAFETAAIVEQKGHVNVAGVPFAPGTEVDVSIRPKMRSEKNETTVDDDLIVASRDRMRELFRTITGFRMSPRMTREELYERGSLR